MTTLESRLKEVIRDIPDFPEKGILFKDITPILNEPELLKEVINSFVETYKPLNLDALACVESRGFWFGPLIAYELGIPMIPIRKKGKLPYETIEVSYDLEYGSAVIEMHKDAIQSGANVLIHDDVLATGGTAEAVGNLIKVADGKIAGYSFLVELSFLEGRNKLLKNTKTEQIHSLLQF